jgi:hypothetical protein
MEAPNNSASTRDVSGPTGSPIVWPFLPISNQSI